MVRGWDAKPEVMGVGGGVDHGDGLWHAWCCLSELRHRDWPQALWLAYTVLEELARRGAKTIQAHARVTESDRAVRCLVLLGFKVEGPDLNVLGVTYKTMLRSAHV